MNINRNNYEEYFILYMDNELSRQECRQVEEFVALHTDLKDELDLLMQFKLQPDASLVYNHKEELMKLNGQDSVGLSNYSERLVLYADNELSITERHEIEALAAAQPTVKKELELLLLAHLEPEHLLHPDKSELYRHETKVRVINYRWLRVAAVLILFLAVAALIVMNNSSQQKPQDVALNPEKSKNNSVEKINESPAPEVVLPSGKDVQDQRELADNSTSAENNSARKEIKVEVKTPLRGKEAFIAEVPEQKKSNNLPQPINIGNRTISNDQPLAQQEIPKEIINPVNLTNNNVTTNSLQPSDNHTAVNASLKETNDVGIDEPGGGKKNKLRGFFRKVTRTFEKRTNIDATDDDDKLLVGGLAIKLK